ncbi:uncharacterized protein MEPE_06729 [Melanopsichium pennsylvanicum]|uniref:Uncharacterized protein n=1 Tax=Melanopsichium pennsylvanicum TaxID=63383 RepID=A0AAJ5C8T7_9BASI|nr:uncharacterized protein MEPE_06729 [Melanopsichium pennsylvanicum]
MSRQLTFTIWPAKLLFLNGSNQNWHAYRLSEISVYLDSPDCMSATCLSNGRAGKTLKGSTTFLLSLFAISFSSFPFNSPFFFMEAICVKDNHASSCFKTSFRCEHRGQRERQHWVTSDYWKGSRSVIRDNFATTSSNRIEDEGDPIDSDDAQKCRSAPQGRNCIAMHVISYMAGSRFHLCFFSSAQPGHVASASKTALAQLRAGQTSEAPPRSQLRADLHLLFRLAPFGRCLHENRSVDSDQSNQPSNRASSPSCSDAQQGESAHVHTAQSQPTQRYQMLPSS